MLPGPARWPYGNGLRRRRFNAQRIIEAEYRYMLQTLRWPYRNGLRRRRFNAQRIIEAEYRYMLQTLSAGRTGTGLAADGLIRKAY
ncbi:hypothetical protein BBB56_12065 [Candidatus Pantoea deserta]|uniref:Uncharacterized protein n=1 Tax=Candidatus Pantoea deserta TaxID=1869313 RepID=A0A3N4NVC8_9GAMM|nr:hypothetical protein BBB56_12065 [Pantoea deserta]